LILVNPHDGKKVTLLIENVIFTFNKFLMHLFLIGLVWQYLRAIRNRRHNHGSKYSLNIYVPIITNHDTYSNRTLYISIQKKRDKFKYILSKEFYYFLKKYFLFKKYYFFFKKKKNIYIYII